MGKPNSSKSSRYSPVDTNMPVAHEIDSVEEGSTVVMGVLASPVIFINLKTLDDRTLRIPSSETQTLREFRNEIEKVTGVLPSSQRLVANGRLLSNEDELLNLEDGSFVHLTQAPGVSRNLNRGNSSDSEESSDEAYESGTVIQAHVTQLQGLAWLVIVFFTLLSWRLFMSIAFHDDPQNHPLEVNIVHFILSLYGIVVGVMGIIAASTRNRSHTETRKKIRIYAFMLSFLAFFYFLASMWEVDTNSNSFMGVFILQSMFFYCIVQAQMTHRALRPVAETQQPERELPVAMAIPTISQRPQPEVEMSQLPPNSNQNDRRITFV